MVVKACYYDNLELATMVSNIDGDVVECGVWRGGMIAGIAEILGDKKKYHLFDSFEGLPDPKEIDGKSAFEWKQNINGPFFHNNCKAEVAFSKEAMNMTGVNYNCYIGWFNETTSNCNSIQKIALLRLDGDWYESTIVCLDNFYQKVVEGGLIIIDDYLTWAGCSKAVHDYLSKIKSSSKIRITKNNVAYIIKHEKL